MYKTSLQLYPKHKFCFILFSGAYRGKKCLCTTCLFEGKDVLCIGIQLCTAAKLHHRLKQKGNTKAKKLAEVGSNEVLRAVIRVHSPANLCAGDRGATKGNTSLWFIEQRFSLTPGCLLFGTNSTLGRNGTRQTKSTRDTEEILQCQICSNTRVRKITGMRTTSSLTKPQQSSSGWGSDKNTSTTSQRFISKARKH